MLVSLRNASTYLSSPSAVNFSPNTLLTPPDFADFAGAPDPSPASISPVTAAHISPTPAPFGGRPGVPYTKWYRVWERTSAADFKQEAFILPFIVLIVLVHLWGTRTNRRKAKAWMRAHAPVLQQEFAVVGFGGRRAPGADDVQASGLAKALSSDELVIPETLMKEKAGNEFVTYATGRQNVAFVDVKLSLLKRYNPLSQYSEMVLGFFFDSLNAPVERMEATSYCFDGKESQLVPSMGGAETKSTPNSTFDGFVWAIVHKNSMRRLRDDRYDISLTSTKDNPKLPAWATVMSEAAEITDALLTPELISAVEKAGEALEALIVTDQPLEQPKKYVSPITSPSPTPYPLTLIRLQTRRNRPQKAHNPLPPPPLLLHRLCLRLHPPALPLLPAHAGPARRARALPARSDAQGAGDAGRRDQEDTAGR